MPEFSDVRLADSEAITWIILNRPERYNALSANLLEELSAALEHLTDNGRPVIGIRGEGRGFSAGYDLHEIGEPRSSDPMPDRNRLKATLERFLAIWDHPKPVIAAVHGACIGGATQLCTFADLTIVSEDAVIGQTKLPIGGGYVCPLWAPLVGPKRAKEMAFVPGNSISGETAVHWGWANHAVPAAALVETVESLASSIAKTPPGVLALKKASINRAMEALGVKHAASATVEMDTLAHLTPEVGELRQWMREVGLDEAVRKYRCDPTEWISTQGASR